MTPEPVGAPGLSVSIVTYSPDLAVLSQTLGSLGDALDHARESGVLNAVRVVLVDNGPGNQWQGRLCELAHRHLRIPRDAVQILSGHGNVGYGAGHNRAIRRSSASYHLILNPDVILDADAIVEAVKFMQSRPDVGMLAPYTTNESGEREYLCKRYPSVLVLAVRGFMPRAIETLFDGRLAAYEMRDLPSDRPCVGVPLASGSFMLARRELLARIGAFSEPFFLYFEDFDLSLRLARLAPIAFVPAVRIVHLGGYTATKGIKHIRQFVTSGVKFFNLHGWRWW